MIDFEQLGTWVAQFILLVSDTLVEDHWPGLIAAFLVVALVVVVLDLLIRVQRRRSALDWLSRIVNSWTDSGEFSDEIETTKRRVSEEVGRGVFGFGRFRQKVASAWQEFAETLVHHREGDRIILRNSVRPSVFFNTDDLGFGQGYWRIVPGLFVTVGLLLTFLGLIAALHQMNVSGQGGVDDAAMANLLAVASAKFIMSVTGLFCSILFTILLRVCMSSLDAKLHGLNKALEDRLSFISLEDLTVEQLEATREQRDHFRSIGLELVEQLARPLREEIPQTISKAIGEAIGPVVDRVSQVGTEGVDGLVRDLSEQLTSHVGDALGDASGRLTQATEQLSALVMRIDQTSSTMGTGMENTVEQLREAVDDLRTSMATGADATQSAFSAGAEQIFAAMQLALEGIRDNTREGAQALLDSAKVLREAAQGVKAELESAAEAGAAAAGARMEQVGANMAGAMEGVGHTSVNAFNTLSDRIVALTEDTASKVATELLGPLETVSARLDDMIAASNEGATQMRRISDGLRDGVSATTTASDRFRSSARALTEATSPISEAVERMNLAMRDLVGATREIANSARSNTRSAEQVLDAASKAIGGERQAMSTTLQEFGNVVQRMRTQSDRLDEMDTKLGNAFGEFAVQVDRAVQSMGGHVRNMTNELTPALDTMREIVEQAEQFSPRTGRR